VLYNQIVMNVCICIINNSPFVSSSSKHSMSHFTRCHWLKFFKSYSFFFFFLLFLNSKFLCLFMRNHWFYFSNFNLLRNLIYLFKLFFLFLK
jgi:hypothetical protein